jgi:hypothetical protein
VSPLLIAAFVLTVWQLLGRPLPRLPVLAAPATSRIVVAVGSIVLVAAFAGQILLLVYQAGHDGARAAWFADTPLAFVDDAYPFGDAHGAVSLLALGLVLLQTAGMGALLIGLAAGPEEREGRLARGLVPFTAGLMAVIAVWSPAVGSGDAFGYVGLGMLGNHVFERPAGFFAPEFARVFDHYPLRPTIYGPLWIGLNAAVVSFGSGFLGKILVLRLFGVLLLAAFAWLAGRLTGSRIVDAAVLLNPFLWLQFVTDAHNDLLAVVLLTAAVAIAASSRPVWAIAAVVAAGLVKLPFLVIGVVVFGRLGARRAILYSAVAVALCVAISAVFGGKPYLDALLATAGGRRAVMDPLLQGAKTAGALSALGVTAWVVLRGRFPAFGGWLYPALAPVLFPWYLVWAVPYALAARQGVLATLIALPVLAVLSDTIYALDAFALLLPATAIAVLVLSLRGPAASRRLPSPSG